MTDEDIQAFSKRVTQANQSELTVITYEIVLHYIDDAIEAIDNNDTANYRIYISKAREFLRELMSALVFTSTTSFNLLKIYSFFHKQLITAEYDMDKEKPETVKKLMNKLLDAFREVAEKDSSPAVMMNTQQVYAGLTYGKGYLNETMLDEGLTGRGFRA